MGSRSLCIGFHSSFSGLLNNFNRINMGGNLDAAIESLLNGEKQTRLAGDVAGTKIAVIEIIKLCYEARAWKTLNDQIVLLSMRRGQVKQVETFGAMAKTEKIAFVLEQVRLCLDRQDYVRAQILSRKISPRAFDADTSKEKKKTKEGDNVVVEAPSDIPSLLELKQIYYELMIRFLLKRVITMEVIQWTALWKTYSDEFENEKAVLGGSLGDKAAEDLKQRIIEHNILVASKDYSRITLKRLVELLCLSLQYENEDISLEVNIEEQMEMSEVRNTTADTLSLSFIMIVACPSLSPIHSSKNRRREK